MIVNFWVYASPTMRTDIYKVAGISIAPGLPGVVTTIPPTTAETFPLLNTISDATIKTLRNFPERRHLVMVAGLWNVYARGAGLHSFVGIREDLQLLEDTYYPDFWVGGAWNCADGEPIGGVGSPWFTYPGDLLSMFPDGILQQVVLMAGQAKRKFI